MSVRQSIIGRFLAWRARHIPDYFFVIMLATLIGFLSGIAAYLLKLTVAWIETAIVSKFDPDEELYIFLVLPTIGIILTVLFIKYIVRDDVTHGIPRILYVISRLDGKMKPHKSYSSMVGGALTAGFGGAVGLESPIISTGASLGSSLGQLMRLSYKNRTLLIGCGAAGAMASIFTTPVAAVVFSLEVLMLDLSTSYIIPLLFSSVTGAITTKVLLSEQLLIQFKAAQAFEITDLPMFIILGLLTGLLSLYFNRSHYWIQSKMGQIKQAWMKIVLGGLSFGLLLFLFPALYGEGYDTIQLIIEGKELDILKYSFFYDYRDNLMVFGLFLLALIILKVISNAITTEAGGIGGIFAPAAVTGGYFGFLFARLLNSSGLDSGLHERNFTLVGMAGVLSGVLHAPLTAIFLIVEMTNSYELIVPLMLVTAISYLTTKLMDPHSIFTRSLAMKGELLTHHKDKSVLTLLNVANLIEKDVKTIHKGQTLGDLIQIIEQSKRNLFVVVDDEHTFLGLITLDEIRTYMFHQAHYHRRVTDFMFQPGAEEKVNPGESMQAVMEKFNKTKNYNLIVIDHGKYLGFVSRANIFDAYRQTLLDTSLHE